MTTVAQFIATAIAAKENAARVGNVTWVARHDAAARKAARMFLPSGSGWDNNTTLDVDASTPEKLVFIGAWHHMDEHGYYEGWTDHRVIVRASLMYCFDIRVSGRNRNGVKDTIAENFDRCLRVEITDAQLKQAYA